MNSLLFYRLNFVLAVLLSLVYILKWKKRYAVELTLIFIFAIIQNLGYLFLVQSKSLEAALMANKIIYLGGIFLTVFMMQTITFFCHINYKKILTLFIYALGMIIYSSVLTIGRLPIFYKSVSFKISFRIEGSQGMLVKEYGFMHTLYYVFIVTCFLVCWVGLIYSHKNKRNVSHGTIKLLYSIEFVSIIGFFGGRFFSSQVDLIPLTNVYGMMILLIIGNRMCLYDITDSGIDSLVQTGKTGFISFDKKHNYLGSNETAKKIFPELNEQAVDKPLNFSGPTKRAFREYIDNFISDETQNEVHYEKDDRIYLINIQHLFDGRKNRGYQFFITDDTADQKYIQFMDKYNATLRDTFGKIVAPQVRDYILENKVTLGGETKRVTVMFCDIRSFTAMSEKMESTQVVDVLNIYFTAMEKCISAHKGIINKYIGDCIMAVFGAPVENERHAFDAFLAAQEMREELKNVNVTLKEKGLPQINHGIGLHTGPVTAGNIGATDRMEWTVIGDTVNVASRIEGLCKEYKKDFLISGPCAEEILKYVSGTEENSSSIKKPEFLCDAAVRGKEENIRLFCV